MTTAEMKALYEALEKYKAMEAEALEMYEELKKPRRTKEDFVRLEALDRETSLGNLAYQINNARQMIRAIERRLKDGELCE